MPSMTRRCPCGHPADRGTHDRCRSRLVAVLVAERYGPLAELERERIRRPYRRAGAR